jgi:elongation factor P hydroxylase
MNKTNSRYPYTYAADYLRENVKNDDGSILSRSVMAHVQQVIADALGLENEMISNALADKFIKANDKLSHEEGEMKP